MNSELDNVNRLQICERVHLKTDCSAKSSMAQLQGEVASNCNSGRISRTWLLYNRSI